MNVPKHPPHLNTLLERWESMRRRGENVPFEELAKDCPELLPELRRQAEAMEGLGNFLQVRAGRARAWSASQEAEVSGLLRRRLMAVIILGLAYAVADWAMLYWSGRRASGGDLPLVAEYLVPCAGLTALLVFLARRQLSLRALRAVELVLFGMIVVALYWGVVDWLGSDWMQEAIRAGHREQLSALVGDSVSVPWFVLIVLYGTCIPNEGRRCALVVGGMALAAMSPVLILWARGGLPEQLQPEALMARTAFYLVIGAAIAVYGSHRISVLTRQASEARQLGQYVLKRYLGAGGMGEVFLAEHQLLNRLCAVKVIRPERVDANSFQRFEREVKATASLSHGSIVEIFDYGHTEDGLFFYAMEYLPGLSLQEMVDRFGPLPPARVVYLLRQLCWGISEAHAVGLIHRDIKPSNILICERGRVYDVAKLVDFGLVKEARPAPNAPVDGLAVPSGEAASPPAASADLTQSGHVVGTPRYMSPEQISGASTLDGRSDLYSLGLVAYFALTGKHPFRGDSFRELAVGHLYSEVPPLIDVCPEVDVDLHAAVMRSLEKEPADRFADGESLEQALANCPCANRWTPAHAAAWWQTHVLAAVPAAPLNGSS